MLSSPLSNPTPKFLNAVMPHTHLVEASREEIAHVVTLGLINIPTFCMKEGCQKDEDGCQAIESLLRRRMHKSSSSQKKTFVQGLHWYNVEKPRKQWRNWPKPPPTPEQEPQMSF